MSWLVDTLIWTGALLTAVLLLRRPVARHFGPQAAYALWLLPFLRLLLPPIELPACFAPDASESAAAGDAADLVVDGGRAAPPPLETAQTFDWLVLVPSLWIAGAAVFLAWRFAAYFQLRRLLLAGARPMGVYGRIRFIETPLIASPLAFGVIDKVVALPRGFMAQPDRHSRDLALEHEIAHHRGHDLLVNFAVQPLFALHWFNPLSWLGWRALRCDQEAACDARVIAARGQGERAAYAALIAGFAAGPRAALAAPMACPVLGDKSIVHRLKSLSMSDISRRRRIAGRLLVAAAVLALPLTASVTYAETRAARSVPAAPLPPPAPEASLVPAPPPPPAAPPPPEAPKAPEAPAVDREHRVTVLTSTHSAGERRKARQELQHGAVKFQFEGEELSEAEFGAKMAALEARLERLDEELELKLENRSRFDEERVRVITERVERAVARAPEVRMGCSGKGATGEMIAASGERVIRICERRIRSHAVAGLERTRRQIGHDHRMNANVRAEVLNELDREIAALDIGT